MYYVCFAQNDTANRWHLHMTDTVALKKREESNRLCYKQWQPISAQFLWTHHILTPVSTVSLNTPNAHSCHTVSVSSLWAAAQNLDRSIHSFWVVSFLHLLWRFTIWKHNGKSVNASALTFLSLLHLATLSQSRKANKSVLSLLKPALSTYRQKRSSFPK